MAEGQQQQIINALRRTIQDRTPEELRELFSPGGRATLLLMMVTDASVVHDIILRKNIKIFGGDANAYIDDFLSGPRGILNTIPAMPPGPQREMAKRGMRELIGRLLNVEGVDDAHRQRLRDALDGPLGQMAGKRRRRTFRRRRGQKSRRHHK